MLILNRLIGERVCIGDDIVVTVLGHRNGQVSIGIAAPADVSIYREEIYRRV